MKPLKNGFGNEGKLTSAVLKELKLLPHCKFWRANVGRARGVSFGERGQPDIMGILSGGRFCGIELKMPGGKTSKDQDAWHRWAIELGALVIVADNLPDAIRGVLEGMR